MQRTLFQPILPIAHTQFALVDYSQCIPVSIPGSFEVNENEVFSPKLPYDYASRSICDEPERLSLTAKNIRMTRFSELSDNERNSRVFDWINSVNKNSNYPLPCCY